MNDTEELAEALLSRAIECFQKEGDLYPFAGYLKADRELFVLHPPPEADLQVIEPLFEALAQQIRLASLEHTILAAALVCKAKVKLPGQTTEETEAICLTIDHQAGPSPELVTPFEAYFPFQRKPDGGYVVDPPVLGETDTVLFPHENRNL